MANKSAVATGLSGKEYKFQRRYAEILDAAAAVFAEKGYHGASTKDVADRLGIRQGSLYYYFSSKEVALEEVCKIGVGGFVSRLSEIVGSDRSARDRVRAAIFAHMQPIVSRRDYVKVFMFERQNLSGDAYENVRQLSHDYETLFEEMLRRGVQAGELRPGIDGRLTVLAVLGMCNAAVAWFDPTQGSIEALADSYADLVLDGMAAN